MKKINILTGIFVLLSFSANAYEFDAGKKNSYVDVNVNNIEVEGNDLLTELTIDLTHLKLKGNSELVLTPMYVDNNGNSAALESYTITGRNRFYWLERNGKDQGLNIIKGWGKKKDQVEILEVAGSIPYEPWLNDATLIVKAEDIGCANCGKGENDYPLAQTSFVEETFETPELIYVTPVAEAVKMRDISARAYIDFVVNRTEINPDFRRNPVELAKIRATIDSVRSDKDITVTKLHISGTASPEGSYQNNVRLAKGRTESLKNYVQSLYRFPQGLITTSFEPVDWQGLADFLKQVLETGAASELVIEGRNVLPHAREILGIVDGNLEPYQRNQKIKNTYPKEYAWLLANVYPGLRHSDYRIEFEIKTYTEVSEILEIMQTQPNKLSLAELFVAANSQQPGSELYNRAFQLAVTMYPDDETANLNAAIAAMNNNNLVAAQNYLSKAGNAPEAEFARAVLTFMQGNEDEALAMFEILQNSTNPEVAQKAKSAKEGIEKVRNSNGFHYEKL